MKVVGVGDVVRVFFSRALVRGDAKCNTMPTEGEEETSWRHKAHDNSIITFLITRGSNLHVGYIALG